VHREEILTRIRMRQPKKWLTTELEISQNSLRALALVVFR